MPTTSSRHAASAAGARTTGRDARPGLVIAVLAVAGVAVSLMQTIIIPLVPKLPDYLHTTNGNTAWALTITLLTAAIAMPIAGRLGDIHGKRLVLILSLLVVVAGSVVCAVTDTIGPFLVGRALQGLGMGAVALGISILRDVLPEERLGSAVALMSAALGIGGTLGLPIAAVIAQHNWDALFWSAAGFTLLCLLAVVAVVPETPTHRARFDYLGAIALATALVLLLVPLSKGVVWGWRSPAIVAMLLGAAVAFAAWIAVETRSRYPLVDLHTFSTRAVAVTNAASAATGFGYFAITVVPIMLLMAPAASGNGNDMAMRTAGLYLIPGGLMMVVFAAVGAIVAKKLGGRIALATGGVVMSLGYLLALIPLGAGWHIEPWFVMVIASTVSAGIGIAYAVMPALIMAAVPQRQTGEANGVNSLIRSLGTAVAAAVVGMLLAHYIVDLDGKAYPTTTGYIAAVVVSLAACVLTTLCALAIPTSTEPTE
ncbi:MAG: MFS transporter [Gordonia sp. (in: high G+C Gram-positive bacteria)]|uniref:MFS transporter n=1 Tax=Gordonia sp. (in: high G+C Gram-positive bacteria) TaxID=84139 RepID=UPI0039E3D030